MTSSVPKVSITIGSTASGRIIFRQGSEKLAVMISASEAKLKNYQTEVFKGLKLFLGIVGKGGAIYLPEALRALRNLHQTGSTLITYLFGIQSGDVMKFMQQAVPLWRRSLNQEYQPPLVEVRSFFNNFIPFEFLPIFDYSRPPLVDTLDELCMLSSRFLGFSTNIYRIYHNTAPINPFIDNTQGLRIRFFKNRNLKNMKEEEDFLSGHPNIVLEKNWPQKISSDEEFKRELAEQLWYCKGISGSADAPMDHIHHFSCHCNARPASPTESFITLTYAAGFWNSNRSVEVTNAELAGEFIYMQHHRIKDLAYPLVFMNACGSANRNDEAITSFPDLFLKNNGRGFIGTETPIPETFGNDFSVLFYKYFVAKKYTVGECLQKSRWELLKKLNNPLGILYTYYGNPDLTTIVPFH